MSGIPDMLSFALGEVATHGCLDFNNIVGPHLRTVCNSFEFSVLAFLGEASAVISHFLIITLLSERVS